MLVVLSTGTFEILPVCEPQLNEVKIRERSFLPPGTDPGFKTAYQECVHKEDAVAYLLAFQNAEVVVPDGWNVPDALVFAGINPRAGELGRKADYIQYGLIQTAEDVDRVNAAMWPGFTAEEEKAAEAAFPGNSEQ